MLGIHVRAQIPGFPILPTPACRPSQLFKKATVSFEVPGVVQREETKSPGGTYAGVEQGGLIAIGDNPRLLGKTLSKMSPVRSFAVQRGAKETRGREDNHQVISILLAEEK